jgi:hypothetical protein
VACVPLAFLTAYLFSKAFEEPFLARNQGRRPIAMIGAAQA